VARWNRGEGVPELRCAKSRAETSERLTRVGNHVRLLVQQPLPGQPGDAAPDGDIHREGARTELEQILRKRLRTRDERPA
jgi:hypothetical protein